MMGDLRAHVGTVELRQTSDIEHLLDSRRYRLGRAAIRSFDPFDERARRLARRIRRRLRR